jgi:hypothetical protein
MASHPQTVGTFAIRSLPWSAIARHFAQSPQPRNGISGLLLGARAIILAHIYTSTALAIYSSLVRIFHLNQGKPCHIMEQTLLRDSNSAACSSRVAPELSSPMMRYISPLHATEAATGAILNPRTKRETTWPSSRRDASFPSTSPRELVSTSSPKLTGP